MTGVTPKSLSPPSSRCSSTTNTTSSFRPPTSISSSLTKRTAPSAAMPAPSSFTSSATNSALQPRHAITSRSLSKVDARACLARISPNCLLDLRGMHGSHRASAPAWPPAKDQSWESPPRRRLVIDAGHAGRRWYAVRRRLADRPRALKIRTYGSKNRQCDATRSNTEMDIGVPSA
jgi:hypothetical protein